MDIKTIAGEAPQEPGVYIMRDAENRIIYVGKARILRNRLSSYFSGEKDIKTRTLLRHAVSIETIIVKDEYEALLLENTLIKQHSPRYNINLKDGKTYPVIRLTNGPFPRVFRTRHIIEDGSTYYGPFPNVKAMDDMLDVIDRIFPLCKCRLSRISRFTTRQNWAEKKRSSPCMYYHIDRCTAPCCGKITPAAYSLQVDRVRKLLSGDTAALAAELSAEMKEEAASLRFERAAQLRNAIKIINELHESSTVVDFDSEGRDYIAWATEGLLATFSIFSMRGGKLTGRELYRAKSASDEDESLELFITSYYNNSRPPPPRIFTQGFTPQWRENTNLVGGWFKTKFDCEPEIVTPTEKHHAAILAMARQNAEEDIRRRIRERGAGPALDELKNLLGLKNRPERIEGFDISQLDGKHPVASLVNFAGGAPDKKNYRHFKLRSVVGVVDDFAAIREAVERRYSRLIREKHELPDLILIDGGIGQVNAARAVLDALRLDCDIAGLAKREEEIWLPNAKAPLHLARSCEALKLLQFVRDESHRFATKLNQKLRSADLRLKTLESVEGIGPKRAAALIRHFFTIEGIAAAELQDIAGISGCGSAAARAVRAAAKLAVSERPAFTVQTRRRYTAAQSANSTADLAADALAGSSTLSGGMAAEPTPEYGQQ